MGNHKRVVVQVPLRFRDIDAMGHVNNAVFFTLFEEGRKAFLEQVLGVVHPADYPFILARLSCDFLKPLRLGDSVSVHVWIGEVGKKSFIFKYHIVDRDEDESLYAAGESTMVFFDYRENKTVPIGPEILEKLEEYRERP